MAWKTLLLYGALFVTASFTDGASLASNSADAKTEKTSETKADAKSDAKPYVKSDIKADIILLVDGASSVSSSGFEETNDQSYYKDYIFKNLKELIKEFDVAPTKVRVGVLFFGEQEPDSKWRFELNSKKSKLEMATWFDQKTGDPPNFPSKYTDVGLAKAGQMLKASERYADPTVAKVVYLMTDGNPVSIPKASAQIADMKKQGYLIFTEAIGNSAPVALLKQWASNESYYQSVGFKNINNPSTAKTVEGKMRDAIAKAKVSAVSNSTSAVASKKAVDSVAETICNTNFAGAKFCWLFHDVVRGDKTLNMMDTTVDSISKRKAILYNGADIRTAPETLHPTFLSLENKDVNAPEKLFPYLDMGDFKDTCVCDPDKCDSGITVMFWLRMTLQNINDMRAQSYTHQYIISSGGQKSDSRGFAFLYQDDSNYKGFKLQLQATDTDYVIEMPSIPNEWFHVAFTWKKDGSLAKPDQREGLYYYENGKEKGHGTAVSGSYPLDVQTHLTIGKPNFGEKYFGRFSMDSFVIYFNVLTQQQISDIAADKGMEPAMPLSNAVVTPNSEVASATTLPEPLLPFTPTNAAYKHKKFMWTFKTTTNPNNQLISPVQPTDPLHNALLEGGAKLYNSQFRGDVLWLENFGAYALLGDFADTCISDPEKCTEEAGVPPPGMSPGLTVSFWLKITSADLTVPENDQQQQHQYILSSGGQVSNSRGFSFLYAAEEQKFKLQLQTKLYVYMIEFDNLQETWCHIAFTWKDGGQLMLYINGQLKDSRDRQEKPFETDTHTKLTVGKPNHIDKHFGRFKLDLLTIFYLQLPLLQIADLASGSTVRQQKAQHHKPEKNDLDDLDTPFLNVFPTTPSTVDVNTPTPTMTPSHVTQHQRDATLTTPQPSAGTTIRPASQPPTPTISGDPNSAVCSAKLDLVLLIDNSGSIEARGREGYFEQIKMFIKNMMKLFKVGTAANVAIIEASSDARVIAKFGDIRDKITFDQYINNLNYKRERSFIGKALELARTDVFAKILCKQSAKLMMVITDGYSSDDVTLSGVELRDLGVIMMGIGYGPESQLMRYTLESLSSDPKDQFTFVFGYDRLIESVQTIVKKACEAALEAAIVDTTDLVDSNPIKGAVSQEFINYFMTEINRYRRMHSAIPLTWSTELTLKAQQWAEYLANEDKLLTKPKVHYGQTLYISPKPGPISAQIAVRAWYNQIIYYDFQKPRISELNSYFVQVVWRSATDVGVGKYQSATGKTYVVAFYNPTGNSDDGLSFNILAMTSSAITGVKTGSCPTGYQPNSEYCYKLYSEPVTWEEAVATCSAQKGALMSITKDEEHYFIFNVLHEHTVKTTWLGLNDRISEGSFTWVDGAPLSFNGWTNPPVIGGQKNCVQLSVDVGWQNEQCDQQNPFICKTIRPGDLIFMVTIHYPTQPWSQDLVYGTTPAAVELIQRVEKLVMSIYGTKEWFLSYTIKAFRGHVSVFIDMELRFSPTSPIDPVGPLKNVTYTEDCDGFICDLTDVQIVPAINVTYNGTCSPNCYTSCTPNCAPACCSPQTLPTYYTYEVVQVPPGGNANAPPPPPPPPVMPPPPPPPPPAAPIQTPVTSVMINFPSYCANECQQQCGGGCQPECCLTSQRKRKRMEILHRRSKISHKKKKQHN